MALHKLVFDTTDSTTIAASANVGAYLRSGDTGKLITYTAETPTQKDNKTFADGDVTVGTDNINISAHGYETGDLVQLTTTGTLPAGLALTTDYYAIRVDSDNIKLASSLANAETGTAVDITAAAGGGTHTVDTQDNTRCALDVYFHNPSLAVTATDLDIRDLTHTQDSIKIGDGTDFLAIDGSGNITVNVNGTVTVSATDFDIRDLSASQDNIAISDGTDTLAVNADGSINSVVTATDLDIRDLVHTADSVRLGNGTSFITSGDGDSDDLTTTAILGYDTRAFGYAYDSAGDNWDRLRSTSGALHVDIQDASITTTDAALADTAVASAANALGVADTAEDLVASPLANRKYLFAYNNGNKTAYIGASGVAEANGFPVPPGSILEMRAGPSIDIEWVAEDTNQEMRTLELS